MKKMKLKQITSRITHGWTPRESREILCQREKK